MKPYVPLRLDAAEIDILRERRDKLDAAFRKIYDTWRKEKPLFKEVCRSEIRAQARTIRWLFVEAQRTFDLTRRDGLFRAIQRGTEEAGFRMKEAVQGAIEFLESDALAEIPFIRIRAGLWAALARKIVAGQREISRGMPTDIEMIATLLPFCDAMFLDNECRALLSESPLCRELKRFDVKVFSKGTGADFLEYLSALENEVSTEQRALVREVYGDLD